MTRPDPIAAAVALNRFGLGARPDEAVPADPRGWLLAQFDAYVPLAPAWAALPSSAALFVAYGDLQRAVREADATSTAVAARQALAAEVRDRYRAGVGARIASALVTPAPFGERMVHFWANHFAVSIEKPTLGSLAGAFEAEAIRPHVFGNFTQMLLAVERHPAMLLYLDQIRSIGPDSTAARRAAAADPERRRGLNENLAREILELHTTGVRSGYSQDDVTELARALTGWSVGGPAGAAARPGSEPGRFAFVPALHEPGARSVLGERFEPAGQAQAEAILRRLAALPTTARHLATKLARHVAGDAPAPALVDRLATAFERSGGDLPSVYRALIESPEAWQPAPAKFKTPWEWTISSLRGLGWRDLRGQELAPMLAQLGQPTWRPGSPAGFDDTAAAWAGPDALLRRVELAQRLAAASASAFDARVLGPQLLPAGLGAATEQAIARADNPATALALLLASPEFLRR